MVDNTQAQVESASPQNKPPLPGQNYGQATVYASIKNNGPNSSDSGRANPPPEPVLLPPSKVTVPSYTQSEQDQYYSVHPELKPMPNLVDMNAVKNSEAVYNYTKNLPAPKQVADVLTLSKQTSMEPSGLVDIYANTETKNGVTTTTTIVPGDEKVYQLQGTEAEQLAQLKNLKADTRTKLILAQGITGHGYANGEITTIANLPFSRTVDKSLNIKNSFASSSNNVPQVSAVDALSVLVPSLGSGLISKGTELLSKVVFKGGKTASEILANELVNSKVPNIKTSTGIIGTEESQARSTIPFNKGGVSSSSTNLGSGGTGVTLTPKPTVKSSPSITGLFEKTENIGKGTTGTFQGDIKEGVSTSTPDLKNTKLEYISNSSGSSKGGLGSGGGNVGGGGSESKLSSSSLFSGKSEQVLKSFTKQASKSDSLQQRFSSNNQPKNNQKQTLVKSFQQQKEKQSNLLVNNTKSDVLTKTSQQQKEKETSILISKTENELLNRMTQKEKDKSMLLFKQSSVQDLVTAQQQKQKQESILVFKQTTETPTKNEQTTETPGGGILIPPFEEQKRRQKKIKSRTAKQVNFLGNAPVANVIGLTRRADITYGNKLTAKLTKKDISNTVHKRESGFNLYRKLSKNQKTKISPHSFKPKTVKKESIYKKLRL